MVQSMSQARREANANAQGRMAKEEVDLLRAAIVFTSSGLDASMKRLINDAGRYLIPRETGARGQYVAFLNQEMKSSQPDASMRDAVLSADPAGGLMDYYLGARAKASFQGSGDLEKRVRNCLGIAAERVPLERLKSLDEFFTVRNSIVHNMDYQDIEISIRTRRIHRSNDETARLCNLTFEIAADILHAAAEVVIASRTPVAH